MPINEIVIKGAREHNLKNVDVTIPRDKLVVMTGLSGSGKSSLAFDTIYADGQRRYVESLSSYARMFLGQMDKPDVDSIEGLSPAISIDQKTTSKNPRSTVGTVTEIYDYLRLLYARIGVPHCPVCGREIRQQTVDQIVDKIMELDEGTKIQLLAPIVRGRKGEHTKELDRARKSGYVRVRIDGITYDLSEEIKIEKNKKHTIEIVVDRLVIKEGIKSRLTDSIETVSSLTGGLVGVDVIGGEEMLFSQNYACPEHGVSIDEVYTADMTAFQRERYNRVADEFEKLFGEKPTAFFSAPGRTEVGGNHTDHNFGCVLAAGVSLDVIAAVAPDTEENVITIQSEGFPMDTVNVDDDTIYEEQKNTSAALIRGMSAGFKKNGHNVGGFKAYATSNVLKGSGLSSSAAYEVLIGTILNGLYNEGEVSAVEIAQIAQFAENVYFGKPSGLMDQMASSVGGFITIDFADEKHPVIDSVKFDFTKSGHALCIVDTKGNHADLTPEYAAIPVEMKSVAAFFGKKVLREITKEQLLENICAVREKCSDRAVLRALHFFDDNERVGKEASALSEGDFDAFLSLINESGDSSFKYLQNIYASSAPNEQGLSLALYLAKQALGGEGACRVHGGGFAGTIQAFVPEKKLEAFKAEMERVFGEGSCYVLSIRPVGGVQIDL